jgi:Ca2+-binding RTX toxin-like protein
LRAGAGDDRILGGPGSDNIIARSGRDTIYGGTGCDDVAAGDGNDIIHVEGDVSGCGHFRDEVGCGTGNDTVYYDVQENGFPIDYVYGCEILIPVVWTP